MKRRQPIILAVTRYQLETEATRWDEASLSDVADCSNAEDGPGFEPPKHAANAKSPCGGFVNPANSRRSSKVLGILDDYRTFWVDPDEGSVQELEYLMAGK